MKLPPFHRRAFALSLLLPVLAACETQPDPSPDMPPADPAEEPGAAAPAPPDPAMEHATIPLEPVDDSGVYGEAMAMHEADAIIVVLDVMGLPGEGEYPAHIHEGSCAEGGGVAAPLNPVTGSQDGHGSSTTTLDADALDPAGTHFVQVHAEDGPSIACGDIAGHGES